MMVGTLGRETPRMAMARMIIGIESCASVMRMMTRSHPFPLKPGKQARGRSR